MQYSVNFSHKNYRFKAYLLDTCILPTNIPILLILKNKIRSSKMWSWWSKILSPK